jgi:hypothetical protein
MAKQTFSRISVKAAAITGAVIGLLCWLLAIPFSFSGYWMVGYFGRYNMMNEYTSYMMNGIFYPYNGIGYYPTGDISHSYSIASVIIDIVLGTLAGLVIAPVYNWSLKLDKR